MKKLYIRQLQFTDDQPDLSDISAAIEKHGSEIKISEVNWQEYSCRPEVTMYCGYTQNEILLKYRIVENYILARHTRVNSPVHEDSCVEFFISAGNGFYYNFEFNCIGTADVGYGEKREGRISIKDEIVASIRTFSTLGDDKIDTREMEGPWELSVAIPFSLFREEEFLSPRRYPFKANFYKCGDELPVPHFLSWNRIDVKNPDFHRPEFFGDLFFK